MKSGGGSPFHHFALDVVAERVGFEPTVPLPAHVLSRHADSAALAPLRVGSSATFGGRYLNIRHLGRQGDAIGREVTFRCERH